jgi:hypothetical protein
MAHASIVQCLMCPAVSAYDSGEFYIVESSIARINGGLSPTDIRGRDTEEGGTTVLCPACARPILQFHQDYAEKAKGSQARLNERILAALKAEKP